MRNATVLILMTIVLMLTAGCGETRQQRAEREALTRLRIDTLRDILREGDVVFRCGSGALSHTVTALDNGIYSHTGIVVADSASGKQMVVHAVPDEPDFEGDVDRVKLSPIDDFFSADHAEAGAVYRLKTAGLAVPCDSIARQITAKALALYARNTPFDHDYRMSDTTAMYCTELVAVAYKAAGIDLVENRKERVPGLVVKEAVAFPSHIMASRHLERVYSYK